jgi:hypothetical protein
LRGAGFGLAAGLAVTVERGVGEVCFRVAMTFMRVTEDV